MSDSENEIDYEALLQTLIDKNVVLQQQVQNQEFEKYSKALNDYKEIRNALPNAKEEFEIEQIESMKSMVLLGDLRSQMNIQMDVLANLTKSSEDLEKQIFQQQVDFEKRINLLTEDFNEISSNMNEEILLEKIAACETNIKTLKDEKRTAMQRATELKSMLKTRRTNKLDLNGGKEYMKNCMEKTIDYESKLKRNEELQAEIVTYEKAIQNMNIK